MFVHSHFFLFIMILTQINSEKRNENIDDSHQYHKKSKLTVLFI